MPKTPRIKEAMNGKGNVDKHAALPKNVMILARGWSTDRYFWRVPLHDGNM